MRILALTTAALMAVITTAAAASPLPNGYQKGSITGDYGVITACFNTTDTCRQFYEADSKDAEACSPEDFWASLHREFQDDDATSFVHENGVTPLSTLAADLKENPLTNGGIHVAFSVCAIPAPENYEVGVLCYGEEPVESLLSKCTFARAGERDDETLRMTPKEFNPYAFEYIDPNMSMGNNPDDEGSGDEESGDTPPDDEAFRQDDSSFSTIGVEINVAANSVCYVDANICLNLQQAKFAEEGACTPQVALSTTKRAAGTPVEATEYSQLSELFSASKVMGQVPSAHYQICWQNDKDTFGTLCLGPQDYNGLTICSFVTESRSARSRYKE